MIRCLYRNLGTSHRFPSFSCIFHINFQFCVFHGSGQSLHFLEHFSSISDFAFSSALAQVCILLSTSHKFPIHWVSMQKSVFRDNLLRATFSCQLISNKLASVSAFSHIFNIEFLAKWLAISNKQVWSYLRDISFILVSFVGTFVLSDFSHLSQWILTFQMFCHLNPLYTNVLLSRFSWILNFQCQRSI